MWKQLHDWDGKPISIEVNPGEMYTLKCELGYLRACIDTRLTDSTVLSETFGGDLGATFTVPSHVTHVSLWYEGEYLKAPQLYRGDLLKPFNLVER